MQTILFVQPSLQPPGGGNGVAAWMLEALKQDYHLSVLTWRPVDLASINRYYGTALRSSDFATHLASPTTLRRLLDLIPAPLSLSLLRTNLLLRVAKRLHEDYDLLISVNNEADFGRPGMQYIHFPWFHPHPATDLRWYHGSATLVAAYYRFCMWLSDFSLERMHQNLTLVNSQWIGDKVRARHGIASTTLYPPVPGGFPQIPWQAREPGFVCIGRISPEKELDKIIDILAAVRNQGWPVHLHLIGTRDDRGYYAHICQRVHANAAWIALHEGLSREALVRVVAQQRYGIHGMTEEHFGMAVAEMVRAGCIVFVPCGGGQVEIVGEAEALLYRTPEDAVDKIVQVLGDPGRQAALRAHLATRQAFFSTERFIQRVRDMVRAFLAGTPVDLNPPHGHAPSGAPHAAGGGGPWGDGDTVGRGRGG